MLENANADGRTQVRLEFVPEDALDADPVLVGEVARKTVAGLRDEGYEVKHISIGARGAPELFQVIVSSAQAAGTFVMVHKDVLEVISTIAGLVATASMVVKKIFSVWEKQKAKAGVLEKPLRVMLEIDGHAVPIEAKDVESAEAMLQWAEQYYQRHPQQVTAQSSTRVKTYVPKKQGPRRR